MKLNGIINLYKEKNITSFKAVRSIKRILGVDKIGHTGTLDPLAQGVLPICVGKATRASAYIMESKKIYVCEMQFGYETDTLDLEGEIVRTSINRDFSIKEIKEAVNTFIGSSKQKPPIYSAIKVNGKKLYEYARNNQDIEIEKRDIFIHDIEIIEKDKDKLKLKIECEKGTYIRSLCRDIGYKLNTFSTMTDLVRISTGKFNIDNAYRLKEIEDFFNKGKINEIIESAYKYINLKTIILNDENMKKYMMGQKIDYQEKSGEYLISGNNYVTIGIGYINSEGQLKSKKRLI